MAYKDFDSLSSLTAGGEAHDPAVVLSADAGNGRVELPDASYVRDASMVRDGMDLVLNGPDGSVVVEDYFAVQPAPLLEAPDGSVLTPALVDSFARSPAEYAQAMTMSDESPVGAVQEISGEATVTHLDGSVEPVTLGTPIYQGDVIETGAEGAVNVVFIDESSFAVSEDARLSIDEYVFDPASQSGGQDFSVLKGMFVFTSGLIGRDDPDDVEIQTPMGSIGIRGTIIAGDADSGEITVVEGAIVLRTPGGEHEITLANQFETGRFMPGGKGVTHLGKLTAEDMSHKFASVSRVDPTLFSSINDAGLEEHGDAENAPDMVPTNGEVFDATGSADQDGDTQIDGTVDENGADSGESGSESGDGAALSPDQGEAEEAIILESFEETTFGTEDGLKTSDMTTSQMTGSDGSGTLMDGFQQDMTGGTAPVGTNTLISTTSEEPSVTQSGILSDTHVTAPEAIGGASDDTVNAAPIHHGGLPPAYLKSAAGLNFNYHFDKMFHDTDGNIANYVLSSSTISTLNGLAGTVLTGTQGTGWTFNAADGKLDLFFKTTLSGVTAGTSTPVSFDIAAVDANGASSGFVTYTVDAYQPHTGYAGQSIVNLMNNTSDNLVITGTSGADSVNIGLGGTVTGTKIFTGAGDDAVTIVDGNSNYINLGDGNNTATITGLNNTFVGGFGKDSFTINGAAGTKAYGMDGDDNFSLNMTALTNLQANNLWINGGHSDFRAGEALATSGYVGTNYTGDGFGSGGRGDSLIFSSAGLIDLTGVAAGQIVGIERIDLGNGGADTLNISYQNVLDMTDGKKTLIFTSTDVSDTVNFQNFTGANAVTQTGTVALDDARQGDTAAMHNYDVYTNGNVTLLVETGISVTGL
ncbi:MAG: FecR domain-containing protein [Alphaproteobacteria bacterium]|nr:FecR domain-containing protein [Alphaproteobacteria bacterium]